MDAERNASFQRQATHLGSRAIAAGGTTTVAEILKVAVQTVALAALARLLSPTDFGLVAMVAAVIGLVALSDLGLSAATVQRSGLTHEEASSLFWLNLGAGIAAGFVVVAVAPAIGWLYGEPRLVMLSASLAPLFVLQGLTAQPLALLQRQLRFAAVALVNVSALLVAAVIAVAAALAGAGYWALVLQQLTASLWACCGAWALAGWRPARHNRRVRVRHLIAFGGNLTAARAAQFVSRNVSRLIIGIATGASSLGGYTAAYNLSFRPLTRLHSAVLPVAASVLSHLQDEPQRLRAFYRHGSLAFNSLTLPLFALLALDAPDVVALVLGSQWTGIVPVFRWLALAAAAQSLFLSTQWLYLALGQGRDQLRWSVVRSVATIAAVAIGCRGGVLGVAMALAGITFLLVPVGIMLLVRATPARVRDFAAAAARPFAATVVATLLLVVLRRATTPGRNLLVTLIFDVVVFGLSYVSAWWMLDRGGDDRRALSALVRGSRRPGRRA